MKKGYVLRDYQKNFCRAVTDAFETGVDGRRFKRVLGTAPTGAGKTIMAAALTDYRVKHRRQKMLFLADRKKLVEQARDKIVESTGIIPAIEMGDSFASLNADIVVASVASMTPERCARFGPNHWALVVADEAHKSLAPNFLRPLQYFAAADVLGITATPERLDGLGLMTFYEHLAYEIKMVTLVDQRHLSTLVVQTAPVNIDAGETELVEGDNAALDDVLRPYWDAIIDGIEEYAADRKCILVFHPSIAASKGFSALLQSRGLSSRHIDGTTKNDKEIYRGFHDGEFRFLNCADLLQTGYDEPCIDCILILRKGKSRVAYMQMVGRGTRLWCPHGCGGWCAHPDRKQDCLILDFLWQFAENDVMGPANLTADTPEQVEELAAALKSGKRLDLFEVAAAVMSEREERLIAALKRNIGREAMRIDARQFAALLHQPELMDYQPRAKWERQPVSDRQAAQLSKFGISPGTVKSRGHAKYLGDALFQRAGKGLARWEQVAELTAARVKDAAKLTRDKAAALLRTAKELATR